MIHMLAGGGGEDLLLRRSGFCPADRLKSNRCKQIFFFVITTKGESESFLAVIDI